ncbi:hypothetical protein ABPG74_019591 [Tetrahymena malaccensis]
MLFFNITTIRILTIFINSMFMQNKFPFLEKHSNRLLYVSKNKQSQLCLLFILTDIQYNLKQKQNRKRAVIEQMIIFSEDQRDSEISQIKQTEILTKIQNEKNNIILIKFYGEILYQLNFLQSQNLLNKRVLNQQIINMIRLRKTRELLRIKLLFSQNIQSMLNIKSFFKPES